MPNLQDHPVAYMKYECTEPLSITRYLRPDRKALMGLQWFMLRKGPAAGEEYRHRCRRHGCHSSRAHHILRSCEDMEQPLGQTLSCYENNI